MTGSTNFGAFAFDAATGVLLRAGEPVRIGARGATILALLLRRRGEVVSKAELIDAAWPDAEIEESNLSVQVAQLRKALGEGPGGVAWIATLPRIGYRFVPATRATADGGFDGPVLAIGTFEVAGAGGIGEELADDVIAALSRFRSLAIPDGRQGAPSYRLRGSMSGAGDTGRVRVSLLDEQGGRHIWAQHFEVTARDGAGSRDAVIDAMAAQVEAAVLQAEITRERKAAPASNALGLFRRAQFMLQSSEPRDNEQAVNLLDEVLTIEPENIAVLAAACEARHHRIAMGWPALGQDDRAWLAELGHRGLRHGEADPGALALFGAAIFRAGDLDHGLALMERAVALNPNDLTALLFAGTGSMHWGRTDAAEQHYRRALRLSPHDPRQAFVLGGLARIRMMRGQFAAALAYARRAVPFKYGYGANHWTLMAASAMLGQGAAATQYHRSFQKMQPGVTVAQIRSGQPSRSNRMDTTLEGLEQAGLRQV